MKRVAWLVAAVLLIGVALFALFMAVLPRDALKTRLGEQVAAWTGREVSLRGDPELSFFPELTVTLRDVAVGAPGGMEDAEIAFMDRLEGTVRLLPLFIGRVEIASFRLVRPRLKLVHDETGRRNWQFDSGAAALQLAFAGDVPLGNFVLEDGTVLYENRAEGTTEQLDSVNLSVNWPSVRQPLAVDGSGIWRGEQVTLIGRADAPFEFLNGDSTPVEARLDSAPIAVRFTGDAADFNDPALTGTITASTDSLRGFAAWLGSAIGPGSTLGAATLAGAASFRGDTLAVENATLTLDGNQATGAIEVRAAEQPDIKGTLAFPTLDLTPYFTGFADTIKAGGDWRVIAVDTAWFGGLGGDVRLSAGAVQIGALQFGDTAASVSLRDRRLEVGVAEARFAGGTLSGSIAVADRPDAPDSPVEVQLRALEFDLAQAGQAFNPGSRLTGTASVAVDAASSGRDLGSLAAGLGGTARLELKDGAFPLYGVAEIAVGGAGAVLAAGGPAPATPVRTLSLGFSFAGGVAVLERAAVAALQFSADAKGWIGLLDGSLGLNGAVRAGPPESAGPAVPFTIGGSLAKPEARALTAVN